MCVCFLSSLKNNPKTILSSSCLFCLGCVASYSLVKQQAQEFPFWWLLQALLQDIPGRRGRERETVGGEGDLSFMSPSAVVNSHLHISRCGFGN